MGEPVLVNPNSFESVKMILKEYKLLHDIGNSREWVFLGCDGPPYRMASIIIDSNKEEFDWLSLIPGFGHLHMNQLKTLFKVCDNILLEPLGKEVLYFESPKAYSYFIEAKDTHKAYQSLEVLLHGACEFAAQYIQYCKEKLLAPSATGFMEWTTCIENETFSLVFQIIFNYALAVYVQKIGVRCNDHALAEARRYKFMPMFFAFNHPIYQEIEYRDLKNGVSYPQEVKNVANANMAFSQSQPNHNHQGGASVLKGKLSATKCLLLREKYPRIHGDGFQGELTKSK